MKIVSISASVKFYNTFYIHIYHHLCEILLYYLNMFLIFWKTSSLWEIPQSLKKFPNLWKSSPIFWKSSPIFWKSSPIFWKSSPIFWKSSPKILKKFSKSFEKVHNYGLSILKTACIKPCQSINFWNKKKLISMAAY